jgi:hypothetical protein
MKRVKKPADQTPGAASDQSYVVGKGKPPEAGKFRVGDGRPRGRRPKGTRNLATDFAEEMANKVTVLVNGEPMRVSRQKSLVMRLLDAASKGQITALQMAFFYGLQFAEAARRESSGGVGDSDQTVVDAFIMRRLAEMGAADQGDMPPDIAEVEDPDPRADGEGEGNARDAR